MSKFIKIGTTVINVDSIICAYVGAGVSIKLPDCIIAVLDNGNVKIDQHGRGELPIGSVKDFDSANFDLREFHNWLCRVLQNEPHTPSDFPLTSKGVNNE